MDEMKAIQNGHGTGMADLGWMLEPRPHLLTCGSDGKIVLRDFPSMEAKDTMTNTSAKLTCMAIHPETGSVAVGDDNNFLKVSSCFIDNTCLCKVISGNFIGMVAKKAWHARRSIQCLL